MDPHTPIRALPLKEQRSSQEPAMQEAPCV